MPARRHRAGQEPWHQAGIERVEPHGCLQILYIQESARRGQNCRAAKNTSQRRHQGPLQRCPAVPAPVCATTVSSRMLPRRAANQASMSAVPSSSRRIIHPRVRLSSALRHTSPPAQMALHRRHTQARRGRSAHGTARKTVSSSASLRSPSRRAWLSGMAADCRQCRGDGSSGRVAHAVAAAVLPADDSCRDGSCRLRASVSTHTFGADVRARSPPLQLAMPTKRTHRCSSLVRASKLYQDGSAE